MRLRAAPGYTTDSRVFWLPGQCSPPALGREVSGQRVETHKDIESGVCIQVGLDSLV